MTRRKISLSDVRVQLDYLDPLSRRLIVHGMESEWSFEELAQALEMTEDEMRERWLTGQGLVDLPNISIEAATSLLRLASWQVRFLCGDLALEDLLTAPLREELVLEARNCWPELERQSASIALLAQVLTGKTFMSRQYLRDLVIDEKN